MRLQLVSEAASAPVFEHSLVHTIEYSFTRKNRDDGFSAWQCESESERDRIEVLDECRSVSGGYSQQALNRFLSQRIFAARPDVVVVVGFWGCTVDLPRLCKLLGVPCVLVLGSDSGEMPDDFSQAWVVDSLRSCIAIVGEAPTMGEEHGIMLEKYGLDCISFTALQSLIASIEPQAAKPNSYDYATYELVLRDYPLLSRMQAPDVAHFSGLSSVLDVGCGAGIFLDLLKHESIDAIGVERNDAIAEYGRGRGLEIESADALTYLQQSSRKYEGIYCSHFVEHLPVDAVQALLRTLGEHLLPGGVLVLVFPDPESIRSQLLGFWRDPEHVRFYHAELIISMAASFNLELAWSSYEEQPHRVASFAVEAPEVEPFQSFPILPAEEGVATSWLAKVMARLGLVPAKRMTSLENRLVDWSQNIQDISLRNQAACEALAERTEALWAVNQTWAWNDNVTIKLRKAQDIV